MISDDQQPRRSALLSFRFLGTALAGSLVMALVSAFGALPAQLAILGCFVSILGGLFVSYLGQDEQRERLRNQAIERLSVPLSLAPDQELFGHYLAICRGLTELAVKADPILRDIAILKLTSVVGQIEALAAGKVVFAGTEAWRTVYETILRCPDLHEYRSVAWVQTKDYWQDQPGRQSMRINLELVHQGMTIERTVILRDHLWPRGHQLPLPEVLPWIEEQHNHGLWVALVRESDLTREPDLLCDVGIYGDRAVGVQELDDESRTLRFTLDFSQQSVRLAMERWRRLTLYATPLRTLLDQLERDV